MVMLRVMTLMVTNMVMMMMTMTMRQMINIKVMMMAIGDDGAYGQLSFKPVSFVVQTRAGGDDYVLELEFRIWACIYSSTRMSTLSYTSKRNCASIEPSIQIKLGSAKNKSTFLLPPGRAKLWPRNDFCFFAFKKSNLKKSKMKKIPK
jgi:hypothetical protein